MAIQSNETMEYKRSKPTTFSAIAPTDIKICGKDSY